MKSVDPNQLTELENYKLLSGSVVPRPIAFVTTEHENGAINAAPYSFFNVVSSNPPLLAISVGRINGEIKKHTAVNIFRTKEFVVHITDFDLLEQMNLTASPYAKGVSELEKSQLTTIESNVVKVPGIKEAKIRMECVLAESIPLGENGTYSDDLIIGKVVHYHFSEDVYHEGKIDVSSLNPLARLAGPNYAKLGDHIFLERPTASE